MQGVVVTASAATSAPVLYLPPADNVLAGRDWGFEAGALAPNWRSSGTPAPTIAPGQGHTGNGAAFLGTATTTTSPAGESAIAVTVTVSGAAYRPTLSFVYRIISMDNGLHDYFDVRVNGVSLLSDSYAGPDYGTVHDLGWKHAWLDLSPYAGQSVEIRFVVVQGPAYASYPTGALLDEVSVGSGPGGRYASRIPLIVAERK